MNRPLIVLTGFLLVMPVIAQESPSYQLTEHTFNAGGDPRAGVVLTSASYRITLDAIGDAVAGTALASGSLRIDGGFAPAYPAPGEVQGLAFSDKVTLSWAPERSAGDYNLYRDRISNLSGLGYGQCERQDLPAATTTDGDLPPLGDGYFYLVTVENRLDEQGTKGLASDGGERQGAACP